MLEWVAISFSRVSSQPRSWTCLSCIGRRMLYHWVTREAHIFIHTHIHTHIRGFPYNSISKESACNAGDLCLIPGLGRSPGEGNGNPLQCSWLENSMDGGAWQVTVHGVSRVRHDLATKPPPHIHIHITESHCYTSKTNNTVNQLSFNKEWLSWKKLQRINAGEDVEKREPYYTAGRNVICFSHYWEQYGDSLTN